MLLEDFDFHLPEELIAQHPVAQRDASRLMTLDRRTGAVAEVPFRDIADLLEPGDLLVVNDTRVIPARLLGTKETGGRAEVFLLKELEPLRWQCMIRTSKPPAVGSSILFPEGGRATVLQREGEGWVVEFLVPGNFREWLSEAGMMPLPPYIRRDAPRGEDRERYQTVFAREEGAVAAPTAGLHFTPELLGRIAERGVRTVPVTLHVGIGTFKPIRVDRIEEHRMHREEYNIPAETAAAVNAARAEGRRVVAVGTTAARTLEHAAGVDGTVPAGRGEADIFIYPGYTFRVVDALVTNFHLPKSTLLLLVSALAGRQAVLDAYRMAVERRFRFFSYGDAMFIS